LTNLVRNGNDLVIVAEIGGHKRLEREHKKVWGLGRGLGFSPL